jgi:hypothetical protein
MNINPPVGEPSNIAVADSSTSTHRSPATTVSCSQSMPTHLCKVYVSFREHRGRRTWPCSAPRCIRDPTELIWMKQRGRLSRGRTTAHADRQTIADSLDSNDAALPPCLGIARTSWRGLKRPTLTVYEKSAATECGANVARIVRVVLGVRQYAPFVPGTKATLTFSLTH